MINGSRHALMALALFLLFSFAALKSYAGTTDSAVGFFADHARGWFWYEKNPDKKRSAPNKKIVEAHAVAKVKWLKETLEKRQQIAFVNPTPDNVERYVRLQRYVMDQSARFAHSWQTLMMNKPYLDYTTDAPVNQMGRQLYLDELRDKEVRVLKDLSKTHGLFYFYSSQCKYCHAMAPIVKRFAEKYDWFVMAVSMDGGMLEAFPDAKKDQGQAARLGITKLPALIAVNPKTKRGLPLAYGFTTEDEIRKRAMALVAFSKGESL